ncbi:hypothetical protein AB4455_19460 [Vibrio sp. 10N.261.46.E12]|uniref:hypothetical protein n=1 Tax=unclassified Vibrio TaxID=2614977 RepID=UPI0010545C9F|nr:MULTISPECIES: hypothetical protein [unclassified Vibrio]
MKDLKQLRRQLEFEMQQLPHYKFLKEQDITRWIDHVLSVEPERATWHMDRLFRFGGSEIGPLTQSYYNQLAETLSEQKFSHSTDIDIFNLKMLKTLPASPNAAMRRGTRFEPIIHEVKREELEAKYSVVRERPDLVDKIRNANLAMFEWARVQVDAIWECDGQLFLYDYKFPSEDGLVSLKYQEPVMYSSQVTIGRMVARELGIEIDKTIVAPYSVQTDSFHDIDIEFNSDFEADIMHVGQTRYDLLKQGKYPAPPIPKHQIRSSSEIPSDMKRAMVEASLLRILSKQVAVEASKQEAIYEDYLKVLATGQNDDIRIEIATSNLTGKLKKNFIKDNAIELLKEHGMDDTDIYPIKNNATKLSKALTSLKIDKDEIKSRCYSFDYEVDVSAARSTKGDQSELLKAAKSQLSDGLFEMIDTFSNDLLDYDTLTLNDGSLDKRQQNQLKTLRRIYSTATEEVVANKAKEKLEIRESAYSAKPNVAGEVNSAPSNSKSRTEKTVNVSVVDKQTSQETSKKNAPSTASIEEDQFAQISNLFTNRM